MKGLLLIVLFVASVITLVYVTGHVGADLADGQDQLCRERFGAGWRSPSRMGSRTPDCVNDQGEGKWL